MSALGDLRFAFRLLARAPIAAIVSVATLGLGVAAPTAVFTLVDTLFLRPLPVVRSAEELVAVRSVHVSEPGRLRPLAWADFVDLADSRGAFAGLVASAECDLALGSGGSAERISGLAVSTNYFSLLGVVPEVGRFFSKGDDSLPVAVLGNDLWVRRFASDPHVVGSPITLNGRILTIVGIAPSGFRGTDRLAHREIWLPLGAYSDVATGVVVPFTGRRDREQEWLLAVGRLRPGAEVGQAQAELDVLSAKLSSAFPATHSERGYRAVPLADLAFGPDGRAAIRALILRLAAITLLVLVVAIVNLAGFFLARAANRRREIAIRLGLGATRGRLLRQLAIEGLGLGALGAATGVLIVGAALPLVARLHLPAEVALQGIAVSGRALGFSVLTAGLGSLAFSLVPLLAWRTQLAPSLRGAAQRTGRRRLGWHELLVVLQLAFALPLLAAAGFLIRTVANLRAVDPGFRPEAVLVFSIDLAPARYSAAQGAAFYAALESKLRHLPGVEGATMISALPIMGSDLSVDLSVEPADSPAPDGSGAQRPAIRHVLVGNDYFQATGISFRRGRDFDSGDLGISPPVAIINESAARRLWPGRDPLGRRLRLVQTDTPFEVIGVVSDTTFAALREAPTPVLYLAHAQAEKSFIGALLAPGMTILVRGSGGVLPAFDSMRASVGALDPRLPVFRVTTLASLLAVSMRAETQAAVLYGLLAAMAIALALLGLFGALERWITEREREIGIRIACGATPRAVGGLVLGQCALLIGVGSVFGLAPAPWLGRSIGPHLFGVPANDPGVWVSSVAFLGGCAFLISFAHARRAVRIDPVRVLRRE